MRIALLPGLDGTGRLFGSFVKALPVDLDPLVVRYPPDRSGSIDGHVEAAASALSANEDWLVLAESFSGPIAARLLVRRPELRILGVVFCASFLSAPRPLMLALMRHAPLKALLGTAPPDWLIRALCLGTEATGDQLAALRQALSEAGSATLAARMRAMARLSASETAITTPCLYIRPTRDRLVPRSRVRELSRRCSDLQIVEIDGPHFILQAAPGPCAEAVARFVEGLPGRIPSPTGA